MTDQLEEDCPPLCSAPDISQAVDRAVMVLHSLDSDIPEGTEYESVSVSVNAEWLASISDALLCYAEAEGTDVEGMFDFAEDSAVAMHKTSVVPTKH